MRLSLNSPAYYSKEYGVNDDIYWMCREISRYMEGKSYSDIVDTIGIVPIIAPKELLDKGSWKENIKYALKSKLVIVSKQIDFDKYHAAGIKEKKKLMIDNILDSVQSIHKKSKLDFEQFKADLLLFLESSSLI